MSLIPITKHESLACPRCERPFECKVGSINLCQCQSLTLTELQQNYISSLHQGCLCANCLLDLRTEYNQQAHRETLNRLIHGY